MSTMFGKDFSTIPIREFRGRRRFRAVLAR